MGLGKIGKNIGKLTKKAAVAPFKEVGRQISVVGKEAVGVAKDSGVFDMFKQKIAQNQANLADSSSAEIDSLTNELDQEKAATAFLMKRKKTSRSTVVTSASGLNSGSSSGKTLLGQ